MIGWLTTRRRRTLAAALLAILASTAVMAAADQASARGPGRRPEALVFFNDFCSSCRADAKKIESWSRREQDHYTLEGVGFMMTTRDSAQFAREMRWRFPVTGDPSGRLAERFHVATPTFIVLLSAHGDRLINYARWR